MEKKWSSYKKGFKRSLKYESRFNLWEINFLNVPIYYNLRPLNYPNDLNRKKTVINFSFTKIIKAIFIFFTKKNNKDLIFIDFNRDILRDFAIYRSKNSNAIIFTNGTIKNEHLDQYDISSLNFLRGLVVFTGLFVSPFLIIFNRKILSLLSLYGYRNVSFSIGDILWLRLINLCTKNNRIYFSNFLIPKSSKLLDERFEEIQHGIIDRFHWDYARIPNNISNINFYSLQNQKMCKKHSSEFNFSSSLFPLKETIQLDKKYKFDFLIFASGPGVFLSYKESIKLYEVLKKYGRVAIKPHPREIDLYGKNINVVNGLIPEFDIAFCGFSSVFQLWNNRKKICVLYNGIEDLDSVECGIICDTPEYTFIDQDIKKDLNENQFYFLED